MMMTHLGPAGSACGVDRGTAECDGSVSNRAIVCSDYASMSETTGRRKVNNKRFRNTDTNVSVDVDVDANNDPAVMNMIVQSAAATETTTATTNATANGISRPSVAPDGHTSSKSTTPKKNRKRPPAFRIKTGSLVALRYRPEGNNVKDMDGNLLEESSPKAVVETWIDPIPGYHQGFMIVGCRIRCCFPKSVLLPDGVVSSASSGRILEGDVVGLVDYEHHAAKMYQALRERTTGFLPVDLLIDRSSILPFLNCVDDTDIDASVLTENERKRFRYEQIIRGIDKVTVRVNLGISYGCKHSASEKIGEDNVLVCKWVIRERVAIAQPLGGLSKQEYSHKLYVGNKFDSHAQQEQNFRWLASRMDSDHTAGRFVGEAVSVRPSCESLATVTIRMMRLPESTIRGRLVDQNQLELYDLDRTREFQVPVEELVVASRKIRRCAEQDSDFATASKIYSEERNSWRHQCQGDNAEIDVDRLVCHRCGVEGTEMFVDHIAVTPSAISCSKCLLGSKKFGKSGTFLKSCRCQGCTSHHALALSEAFKSQSRKCISRENQQMCVVCCLHCKSGMACNDCGITIHKRCAKWIQNVDSGFGMQAQFLCRPCRSVKVDLRHSDILMSGLLQVQSMDFTDFDLPPEFASLPGTEPATKPIVAMKPRRKTIRRLIRKSSSKPCDDAEDQDRHNHSYPKLPNSAVSKVEQCCEDGLTESCLRLLPYDPIKRSFEGIAKHQAEGNDSRREVVRNLRSEESTKREEKKTAVRAARASQRRMMKDVAAFGSSFLELDALAGRESHLRFGRSGIHAWGVFADQEIREGEVIVEYRGEIIGNATAEKREAEYAQAKIGSDYMFRMDGNTVCDATKRGNVARYINASCDPNCYTQIISINNTKRIVIYAKKDIPVGKELCYDYKFPVEFDEAKRVACYCGAKDCRGFMNWDKRYVSVAAPTGPESEPIHRAPRISNYQLSPNVGIDAPSGPKPQLIP